MNFNLSKWLKDDLGLRHMSEADMNSLVYHPRHGSLCRRLVKFLTESTLCTKKYPNVYAKEEHEGAGRDCEIQEQLSAELLSKLEEQIISSGNAESKLKCLIEKHQCLTRIEDLSRTSIEALETVVSRPSISSVSEVADNLKNLEYLGNLSLENLYTSFPSLNQKLYTSSDKITRRDLAIVNDEYQSLIGKAQIMHDSNSELLTSTTKAMIDLDCDIDLEMTSVACLQALKMPDCDEVELEYDEEERELIEHQAKLLKEVRLLDQEVNELKKQHIDMKASLNRRYKEEIEKDLRLLRHLREIEMKIYSI